MTGLAPGSVSGSIYLEASTLLVNNGTVNFKNVHNCLITNIYSMLAGPFKQTGVGGGSKLQSLIRLKL